MPVDDVRGAYAASPWISPRRAARTSGRSATACCPAWPRRPRAALRRGRHAAARVSRLAEELKHAILFHRLAVGLDPDFALKDVPYAHYTFHLPRESWADDALFHFLVDLNGAFHARDWRDSSYAPLAEMSNTVERDELGHSEMGYRFLREIVSEARGRALVQRLLAKWYPAALDMFGRSDSKNAPKFLRWGLKSVGNAEIRAAYKTYVDAKVVGLGLEPPDERANRRFL